MRDLIERQDAIDAIVKQSVVDKTVAKRVLAQLPSAGPEIIRCKDCKDWIRQTNNHGFLLLYGFCNNEHMWNSLHGEIWEIGHIDTNEDHFCGYAERKEHV